MNFNQEDVDNREVIAGEYRHNWNEIARGLNEINRAIQHFTDIEEIVVQQQAGVNIMLHNWDPTAEEEMLDRINYLVWQCTDPSQMKDGYTRWVKSKMTEQEARADHEEHLRELQRNFPPYVSSAERQAEMDL